MTEIGNSAESVREMFWEWLAGVPDVTPVESVAHPTTQNRSKRFVVDTMIFDYRFKLVCALLFRASGASSISSRHRIHRCYNELPCPWFVVRGWDGARRILPLVLSLAGERNPIIGEFDRYGFPCRSRSGRLKTTPVYAYRWGDEAPFSPAFEIKKKGAPTT